MWTVKKAKNMLGIVVTKKKTKKLKAALLHWAMEKEHWKKVRKTIYFQLKVNSI